MTVAAMSLQKWKRPYGRCQDQHMSECQYNAMLSAYHDGELDADSTRLVSEHLTNCPACANELREIEEISRLFADEAVPRLSMIELARLHQNLDRGEESDLLRTAGLLTALAASVLIVSAVWLAEFPTRHAAAVSPAVAVVPASEIPAWERAAITLNVDPLPDFASDPANMASADARDAAVANWMIDGVAGRVNHENP